MRPCLSFVRQREDAMSDLLLLEVVVVDFDAEDYSRAYGGDDIGDHQRPIVNHYTLHDKEYRAEAHHTEGGHGYAVGVARAHGGNSLRHIAENHADCGQAAEDVVRGEHCGYCFHCGVYVDRFFLMCHMTLGLM